MFDAQSGECCSGESARQQYYRELRSTQILDNVGAVWTIASSGAILRDGVQAAGGWGSKIRWTNSTIYVYGTDGNWWRWTGTQWLNVGTVI